jgi:hypothetical protein
MSKEKKCKCPKCGSENYKVLECYNDGSATLECRKCSTQFSAGYKEG